MSILVVVSPWIKKLALCCVVDTMFALFNIYCCYSYTYLILRCFKTI